METGPRFLTEGDLSSLDTAIQTQLGAVGVTLDGRRFRYVKFGGTSTINPGLLMVTPAVTANSTGLTIATGGLTGATTLVITNGATAVTQDQFAGGYVDVIGSGHTTSYRIDGNSAAGASGAITLLLRDPLRTTVTAGTDTVNLSAGPYSGVTGSTTLSNPVGVTVVSVPNSSTVTNFGWVQTSGHAFVSATSGTKGQPVTQDLAGTAGFVANTGAGAAETSPQIGVFKESAASSTAPVELNLP